jgi:hypothetical protein
MTKIDIANVWTAADLRAALEGAEGTVEFFKTPKKQQTGSCWCGCGASTKSRFAPGHDSKFHSLAKRVARDEETMPESFVNADAEADFLKWHDAEVPKHEARLLDKAARTAQKLEEKEARDTARAEKAPKKKVKKEVPAASLPTSERFTSVEKLNEDSEEYADLLAAVTMS